MSGLLRRSLQAMLFLCIPIVSSACSRDPKKFGLQIGKTISLKPATVNSTEPSKEETPDLPGLHMTLRWGGREPHKDDGLVFRFYRKGALDTAHVTATWAELEQGYKTSGCKDDMIETLDGPMPATVLLCDGRVRASELGKIDAVSSSGEVRSTTEFSTYKKSENVLALTAHLY